MVHFWRANLGQISRALKQRRCDDVAKRASDIYPSYFGLLRTGGISFETTQGLSLRRFPLASGYERAKIIPNLGLFGRAVCEAVARRGINRLGLDRVEYGIRFGPVGFDREP